MTTVERARSFLFVPGDRPERFEKAAASQADVVIVDLEDAVAVGKKQAARDAVVGWLAAGATACVRVNQVDTTEGKADLAALAGVANLLAVVVPKPGNAADVRAATQMVGAPVVPLIETARGLASAHSIAVAPGVIRLAFGHLDYALDAGSDTSHLAMLHARSSLVVASRAAGLPWPIDGVTADIGDTEALAQDLAHARALGMTGKLLIHPRQVEATHAAYAPSDEEVAWARRVLAAVGPGSRGAIQVDGKLVDAPVIGRAGLILRMIDNST